MLSSTTTNQITSKPTSKQSRLQQQNTFNNLGTSVWGRASGYGRGRLGLKISYGRACWEIYRAAGGVDSQSIGWDLFFVDLKQFKLKASNLSTNISLVETLLERFENDVQALQNVLPHVHHSHSLAAILSEIAHNFAKPNVAKFNSSILIQFNPYLFNLICIYSI